jgi:nitrate/nitrite transporter NarK
MSNTPSNTMGSNPLKGKLLPVALLAASCGMTNILYLCVVFYVPFRSSFGFSNAQMGSLLAVFALLSTPGNFVCGVLADIWNPKHMLVTGCLIASGCAFWLATIPNYQTTLIIYTILAIPCGFLFWAAYTKCMSMMGSNLEQGRLFGLANTIDGSISCFLFIGLAAIFGNSINTPESFRLVILVFASVYLLVGLGIFFFYDYKKWSAMYGDNQATTKREKFSWKEFGKSFIDILKEPITYIATFMVMGSYMASSCFTYLSPYLNVVYIMPVALASAFGAITRYGVKIVAAPIGGTLRDTKLGGSTSKLGWVSTAGVCVGMPVFLLLPKNPAYMVPAVAVALIMIFFFRLNNSSESTVYRQLKRTPVHLIGRICGLVSVFGYCSDLWLPTTIGKILDANGDAGYKYVFLILCGSLLMMSFFGYLLYRLYRKEQMEEAATVNAAVKTV